ncbi:M16 family metallopeptidase [Bdellovibrionota bacterium]
MSRRTLLLSLVLVGLIGCTKPPAPDHYGITRTTLKNGVTLIIKEDHRQPMVAVTTLVKTRETSLDEFMNGVRLLSERLFFKESKKYPIYGSIDRALAELGGQMQATTTIDFATYGTIVPATSFPKTLKLFAESYKEPELDPSILETAKDLIIQQQAFPVAIEGYPFELNPDPNALRSLTREEILTYWNERFHPELLVVTIIGNIPTQKAFRIAQRTFGRLKRHGSAPEVIQRKPAKQGFVFKQQQDRKSWAVVSFITEGLSHADRYPLYLLSLWLKSKIQTKARIARDYGVIEFTLGPKDGSLLEAEKALFKELERMKREPIPENQLTIFRSQAIFEGLRKQERIDGLALNLAIEEQYGDYEAALLQGYRLAAVTGKDVQNVALRYFSADNASVREFSNRLPAEAVDTKIRESELFPEDIVLPTPVYTEEEKTPRMVLPLKTIAQPSSKDIHPQLFRLSSDIPVLIRERHDFPLVSVIIQNLGARSTETIETAGITNLALRSAMHTPQEETPNTPVSFIAQLGGRLGVTHTADAAGYTLEIVSINLKQGIETLTKLITAPKVTENSLVLVKNQSAKEIQQQIFSPFSISLNLALEAAFGKHPYVFPAPGRLEAIQSFTKEEVEGELKNIFNPTEMRIVIVGDVDSTKVRGWLEEGLRTIKPKPVKEMQPIAERPEVVKKNVASLPIPYSATTMLFNGPMAFDPDFASLHILSSIVGGPGGRFPSALTEDRKVASRVATSPLWTRQNGAFAIFAQMFPGQEDQAQALLLNQIRKLRIEGVMTEEFERGKKFALSQEHLKLLKNMDLAVKYAAGLTMDFKKDWPSEFIYQLQRTDKDDIRRTAIKYLTPDRFVIGEIRGQEPTFNGPVSLEQ